MTKLTKRQQEILTLIQSHMAATGSPPTRAEIAKTMGFRSPNAAEDHLRALARKGVIDLVPGTSRGIRLTQTTGIPIINRLNSKTTVLSEENIEGRSRLDRAIFQPHIDFLWRISGSQLEPHNILDGDYLAVHQTNAPTPHQPNQLLVVRQHNELTVQRYSSESGSESQSNNKGSDIEGIVVGVIRNLGSAGLSSNSS